MVGAGRERSEAPSSARGGRGTSIPPHTSPESVVRQYADTGGRFFVGACPPGEEVGEGGREDGRGGRGGGRGRKAATPSSPPPPADSPEHRTARVDPSEVEATRTPVHEPRVDEPSSPRDSGPRGFVPRDSGARGRLRPSRRPDGIPGRIC